MSEPVFRLGVSRAASREQFTFWELVRGWFRRSPAPPRLAPIPRPPRAVLLARTTAENSGEATTPASSRSRSLKRR